MGDTNYQKLFVEKINFVKLKQHIAKYFAYVAARIILPALESSNFSVDHVTQKRSEETRAEEKRSHAIG